MAESGMNEQTFLDGLDPDQRTLLETIRPWIDEADPNLEVRIASVMGNDMLAWCVNGEYRYGFTSGKFLSFHNMAVYCNPDIHAAYMGKLGVPKSRVKKSCLSLSPKDKLNTDLFKDMLKACAAAS